MGSELRVTWVWSECPVPSLELGTTRAKQTEKGVRHPSAVQGSTRMYLQDMGVKVFLVQQTRG